MFLYIYINEIVWQFQLIIIFIKIHKSIVDNNSVQNIMSIRWCGTFVCYSASTKLVQKYIFVFLIAQCILK